MDLCRTENDLQLLGVEFVIDDPEFLKREGEVVLCRINPTSVARLVELPVHHDARRQDRKLEAVLGLRQRRRSDKFLECLKIWQQRL